MNAPRTGDGPGDEGSESWASELLPLSVRRQLLERDVKKAVSRVDGGHGVDVAVGPGTAARDDDGPADNDR